MDSLLVRTGQVHSLGVRERTFPSGDRAERILPFINGLNAALKSLESRFRKGRLDLFCGADANVQFNMIDDDAG